MTYSATTYKFATASGSGDTTIWTPTTGTAFHVLGGLITAAADAVSAGNAIVSIKLTDGAGGALIFGCVVGISTTAPGSGNAIPIPIDLPDNGFLSGAVNTVLVVNLSAAFGGGSIGVYVYGIEEG